MDEDRECEFALSLDFKMQNSNFLEFHGQNPKFIFDKNKLQKEQICHGPWQMEETKVYVVMQGQKVGAFYFEGFSSLGSTDEKQDFRERTAILDVVCLLAQGRNRPRLALLNFREIENYLRNSPLEPLWEGEIYAQKEAWFENIKQKLIHLLESHWPQLTGVGSEYPSDLAKPDLKAWKEWTMLKRIAWVESFFNLQIRPVLNQDGGDLVIIDVDDETVVFAFKGVCLSCPAKLLGTKWFIEDKLKEQCFEPLALKLVAEHK